jgi:hypothetical protein
MQYPFLYVEILGLKCHVWRRFNDAKCLKDLVSTVEHLNLFWRIYALHLERPLKGSYL